MSKLQIITVLIEKFTKVRLSLLVDIGIAMSLFLGVLVGECFLGFYKIKYYDRVLHFLGTLELCVLGYAIAKVMLRHRSAKRYTHKSSGFRNSNFFRMEGVIWTDGSYLTW